MADLSEKTELKTKDEWIEISKRAQLTDGFQRMRRTTPKPESYGRDGGLIAGAVIWLILFVILFWPLIGSELCRIVSKITGL
jgi:hypothetical protein